MQDQLLLPANKKGLIVDLPRPFWQVLGRNTPPRTYHEFLTGDRVAVAAEGCGCLLVRSKEWNQTKPVTDGKYMCTVCQQSGGRNVQECHMLGKVRDVVGVRAEDYVICVQMPLHGTRCDVVLVPVCASTVHQLVVLELDGSDHAHRPRQYGKGYNESWNLGVQRDNKKARLVRDEGMQFMRIDWFEMQRDPQAWIQHLNFLLDTHVLML